MKINNVALLTAQSTTPSTAFWALLASVLYLFVLIRFGLVATILAWYVFIIFTNFPMTLQMSAWYSSIGFAGLFVILAITLYGFRMSLGSRPFISAAGAED